MVAPRTTQESPVAAEGTRPQSQVAGTLQSQGAPSVQLLTVVQIEAQAPTAMEDRRAPRNHCLVTASGA